MNPGSSGGSPALFVLLLAVAVLVLMAGCSGPDPENQAHRPWGGAGNWQGNLPSGLTEGR